VILIVTGENPDGHERFATWYNSVAIGDANRSAFEHRELGAFTDDSVITALIKPRQSSNNSKRSAKLVKLTLTGTRKLSPIIMGSLTVFFSASRSADQSKSALASTNKWLDVFGRAKLHNLMRVCGLLRRDVFDLFIGILGLFSSFKRCDRNDLRNRWRWFKGLRWTRDDGSIVTFRESMPNIL
jgi:hypothetical protein